MSRLMIDMAGSELVEEGVRGEVETEKELSMGRKPLYEVHEWNSRCKFGIIVSQEK